MYLIYELEDGGRKIVFLGQCKTQLKAKSILENSLFDHITKKEGSDKAQECINAILNNVEMIPQDGHYVLLPESNIVELHKREKVERSGLIYSSLEVIDVHIKDYIIIEYEEETIDESQVNDSKPRPEYIVSNTSINTDLMAELKEKILSRRNSSNN